MAGLFLTLNLVCVGCPHNNKTFWQFCNSDEDYDRSSPTKQNIQCLGRSANEVIASSCDKRRKITPSENLYNFNERDSRNFVTLPSSDQQNFVTISPKNKLRRNPNFEDQPSSVDHQIVRQILPQVRKKMLGFTLKILGE